MFLVIENVTKMFPSKKRNILALKDFSLTVDKGEFVCLLGPSGCGKTTLINLIAGLDQPTSGNISLNNKRITRPGTDRVVMFQEPALLPWLKVHENIAFGMKMAGYSAQTCRTKTIELLETVKLQDFSDVYIHQLSGGMKQRVSLARTFSMDADVMLMDEPFSALDAHTRLILQDELINLRKKNGKTILFITHSPEEACRLSDRIVLVRQRPGSVKDIVIVPQDMKEKMDAGKDRAMIDQITNSLLDEVTNHVP